MRRFLRTTIGVVFSASQITAFVSFSYHMLWDCHHHEWFVFLFWVGGKHLEKPKNWGLWLPPKMIAFIQAYGKFMSSLHRSVVKFPIFLTTSWEQICLNCALCLSVLAISLHVCVWSNCEVMWLACVTLRSAALAPYHYHTFTLLYSEKVRCATFFSPSILLA